MSQELAFVPVNEMNLPYFWDNPRQATSSSLIPFPLRYELYCKASAEADGRERQRESKGKVSAV